MGQSTKIDSDQNILKIIRNPWKKTQWKSIGLISMKLVGDTLRNSSKNPPDFEDVLPFLSAQVHKLFLKYLDNHWII